jgi:NADH pyrophosphatase NudC (nudix superfamily)
MAHLTVMGIVAALIVGFAAGLLTFKRSSRWCPVCGATLRCLDCAQARRSAGYSGPESGNTPRPAGQQQ